MNKNNLSNIVDFTNNYNSFSDFNFVNNFLLNLNFTKYKSNKFVGGADEAFSTQEITGPITQIPITQTSEFSPPITQTPEIPIPEIPTNPMVNPLQVPPSPLETTTKLPEPDKNDDEDDDDEEEISKAVNELTEEIEKGTNTTNLGVNEPTECQTKTITNDDGTKETRQICEQKIITMPDVYLPKPNFMNSDTEKYVIKKGTILYHSTVNKRGFNTKNVKLGNDNLISFFTPNFRLASDTIQGCSIEKQKGFIHVFEVTKDIPDIYIKLPYDTDEDLNLDDLKNKFCNGTEYYKGVGFFYPKNEIEMFNNTMANPRIEEIHENLDDNNYYSEFALCSPGDYLSYLYSQKCMSLRKLSKPYRFDGKFYN